MDDVNVTTERSWRSAENFTFNFTRIPTDSSSSDGGGISVFLIVIAILLLIFAALIVNQAVADFMVSVIPMPLLTITILFGHWPFGRVMCGIWCLIDYSSTLASVYALVAICIDRLWATKWCHHYRKYNTRKKVVIMCLAVW